MLLSSVPGAIDMHCFVFVSVVNDPGSGATTIRALQIFCAALAVSVAGK